MCGRCELQEAAYRLGIERPSERPRRSAAAAGLQPPDDRAQPEQVHPLLPLHQGLQRRGRQRGAGHGLPQPALAGRGRPGRAARRVVMRRLRRMRSALSDRRPGREEGHEPGQGVEPRRRCARPARTAASAARSSCTSTGSGTASSGSPAWTGRRRTTACCASRGGSRYDFPASPQRLTQPLMRRRTARLEPVSWDEALDYTAARLREIRDAHGPDVHLRHQLVARRQRELLRRAEIHAGGHRHQQHR